MLSQPADAAVKANLYNTQLVSEGHIAGSRVVMVIVDFQARMDATLKEMRALVERVDPDRMIDYSQFPEVETFMKTPVKPKEVPASTSEGGLGSLLAQPLPIPEPTVIPVLNFRGIAVEGVPQKSTQRERPPSVPREKSIPPPVPRLVLPSGSSGSGKGTEKGSGPIRRDLSDRWGTQSNPARKYPEQFEHMRQPSPRPIRATVDLEEPVLSEPEKVDLSPEEEYRTETESSEDPLRSGISRPGRQPSRPRRKAFRRSRRQ